MSTETHENAGIKVKGATLRTIALRDCSTTTSEDTKGVAEAMNVNLLTFHV